jgi:hypothetical protein
MYSYLLFFVLYCHVLVGIREKGWEVIIKTVEGSIKFIKKRIQMHFGLMHLILLYSDHWHVSATRVAIFSMLIARIEIYV